MLPTSIIGDLLLSHLRRQGLTAGHSLDAVQDLIKHETFGEAFTDLAKGMPDLERIVSRIHANNCKVKDFVKVLSVSRSHL